MKAFVGIILGLIGLLMAGALGMQGLTLRKTALEPRLLVSDSKDEMLYEAGMLSAAMIAPPREQMVAQAAPVLTSPRKTDASAEAPAAPPVPAAEAAAPKPIKAAPKAEPARAKNVVYFIVDGMGPTQVTAARIYKGGSTGQLAMESFPYTGYLRTWSSSDYVTDSAAAGTALAAGIKTYNGAIGVSDAKLDPAGVSRDVESLADVAAREGKAIGIITTSKVTDATPSAFYAHVKSRGEETEIASQATTSSLTVLMGGGRMFFRPTSWIDPETSATGKREDGTDMVEKMVGDGWTYVESLEEFNAVDPQTPGLRLLGLFDDYTMLYEMDRANDVLGEPSLAQMVAKALRILEQDPDGYFLMVESGRVDHAGHANDARRLCEDMLAMDKAVETALAETTDQTLIVVTADHETGGMAINGYHAREGLYGDRLLMMIDDGTTTLGLVTWGSGPGGHPPLEGPGSLDYPHASAQFGGAAAHNAVDVPVVAIGPGAERFTGYMQNSDIPQKIAAAMGLAFNAQANQENRKAMEALIKAGVDKRTGVELEKAN